MALLFFRSGILRQEDRKDGVTLAFSKLELEYLFKGLKKKYRGMFRIRITLSGFMGHRYFRRGLRRAHEARVGRRVAVGVPTLLRKMGDAGSKRKESDRH